jgi:glycosyltransferase EpsD
MKILFVATVTLHIKSFHLPYLQWFKEQGWEVHVATRGNEPIPHCYVKHDIPIRRTPFSTYNIKAFLQLKRIVEREGFDVIHGHTPMGGILARLCGKKQRKRGTRVLYTAHGFHFYKGAPLINWLVYYPIEKWLSRHTDTLVTINREDYALAKRKMKAKEIVYIPGVGLDVNKFFVTNVDKDELRRELFVPPLAMVILSVGELNKNKNHEMVIRTLSKLNDPNLHYYIAGTGKMRNYLESLAKSLGIGGNVHFLGFVADTGKLYASADIFLFPSLREGLPVSLMEAMSAGLPCVVSNIRGNMDLIEHGKGGYLCCNKNAEDYIGAIKILAADPGLRKNMGQYNRAAVKKYDINAVMPQTFKLYSCSEEAVSLMRVLHIFGALNKGGAESRTMDIYRAIDKNRVQFDFAVHTGDQGLFEPEILGLGGRVYRSMPRFLLYNFLQCRKAWLRFFTAHRYDCIHIHMTNMAIPALLAAKELGITRLICHARVADEPNLARRLAVRISRRWLRALSTQRFAVSDEAGRFIFGRDYIVKKNAIPANLYRPDIKKRQTVRERLGLRDAFVIGHVGRFHNQKNHLFLLDVFLRVIKHVPHAHLLLAGDGENRPQIESRIAALGMASAVTLLGIRDDIPDLLQSFDIFVMPSLFEGMPGSAIEAQASGLPCLLSDTITPEAQIVNCLLDFIPIDKGSFPWVNRILEHAVNPLPRRDTTNEIRLAGYDIHDVANWYENFYCMETDSK